MGVVDIGYLGIVFNCTDRGFGLAGWLVVPCRCFAGPYRSLLPDLAGTLPEQNGKFRQLFEKLPKIARTLPERACKTKSERGDVRCTITNGN